MRDTSARASAIPGGDFPHRAIESQRRLQKLREKIVERINQNESNPHAQSVLTAVLADLDELS